jgi:uncharacterized Tic20 family protein
MENFKPWGLDLNTFLMLMHLSQFAGIIIPGAGLILPVIMWLMNKDESPEVDQHGRVIMNWIISALIYAIICVILIIIVIGLLGLYALGIINLVFVIIGAIKANNGELWNYPLSIKVFKV